MTQKTGTLRDLNVQPGDVVQYIPLGGKSIIREFRNGRWYSEGGKFPDNPLSDDGPWRIVSRATPAVDLTGPVRTVTRKEIVPGQYGLLTVEHRVGGCQITLPRENFFCGENADELRAAIATLSEIADALEGDA